MEEMSTAILGVRKIQRRLDADRLSLEVTEIVAHAASWRGW
jgi:hypothetical protein